MDTCEDEFIRKAAYGDQEAFRHLWDAHHAICHTPVAVEDERFTLVR